MPLIPRKRTQNLLLVLLYLMLSYYGVFPFLLPLLDYPLNRVIESEIDVNVVCLQTTDHHCGPAAALTFLSAHGIEASEGRIAVEARTAPILGTQTDLLKNAIDRRLATRGKQSEFHYFQTIDAMKPFLPVLTVVDLFISMQHLVTVIDISDTHVLVGDPLEGLCRIPRKQFRKEWRHAGIGVRRQGSTDWDLSQN